MAGPSRGRCSPRRRTTPRRSSPAPPPSWPTLGFRPRWSVTSFTERPWPPLPFWSGVARARGLALSLSSDILPEMREFERTSTAVTNAYVMPVMAQYLEALERELGRVGLPGPLLVMQSNGGVMTAEHGRRRPVHVIESGPAAGVIATAALARRIGEGNVISIDMGGTTAKASVIEGFE